LLPPYAPALKIVKEALPFKRRRSRLAFVFSCLLHIAAGALVFFAARKCTVDQWPSMGPKEAGLNIMQIELQPAAASSPAQPVSPPSAPLPPEPAEVPLKEPEKVPESQPEPKPEPAVTRPAEVAPAQVSSAAQTAQTAQQASAPAAQVAAAEPLAGQNWTGAVNWRDLAIAKLRVMVEREKYYPPSAQKAGYTGRFRVRIRLEPDGTVSGCEIAERHGHPLLGKAVETTLEKIKGRTLGMTLPERFDILLPIEFELN
jgi:TonB family protein